MSFPLRIAEVTVDWLNEVLAAKGVLGGRRIVGFDAAPASGRGGTSSVQVLTLTYDLPTGLAPKKVVAKFSSESESVREAVREYRLYQREIAFYEHYGMDPGIPTPACYASAYDEGSNTCVLLLEHIDNARSREAEESDPRDIDRAVRCLAPFHARWWGRETALAFIESEYSLPALEKRIEKAARAHKRIQAGGHRGAFGETNFAILELWLAHARPLADYCGKRPLTMCHGSFHRGQLLFPDHGAGPPWVIDWQNVSVNIGAHDLARIVVSGLRPEQRRQHERPLMALYQELLLEHGVREYPMEQLWGDYRSGIVSLIVFHSLMLADYPVEVITKFWKGKEPFWEVLFRWPGEAAEEADALGWIEETVRPFSGKS